LKGAKLKSKPHLQNTFFIFFEPFFAQFGFRVFQKSKKILKNAEFYADFESVKIVFKNAQKSYKKNMFDEYEKKCIFPSSFG
jgi:hypothetical protein